MLRLSGFECMDYRNVIVNLSLILKLNFPKTIKTFSEQWVIKCMIIVRLK